MEEEGSRLTLRKNRGFHLYLLKVALTSLAFSIYSIFIPIFSYTYSGSLLFTGIVLFAQYGVYSLVFLTGPIVDRVKNKRTIFSLSYSIMAACSAVLAVAVYMNSLTPEILIALVIAISVSDNFAWTAGHTVLPFLVNKSEFFRANGYTHLISGTHAVGGFVLSGVIILFLGYLDSIVLYSSAMAAASIVSLFIPLVMSYSVNRENGGFTEGWKYLASNHKPLITMAVYLSLISFFGLAPTVFILQGTAGSSWYIILYASFMVGGSVSGPLLGVLNMRKRIGSGIVFSAMAYAVLLMTSSHLFADPFVEIPIWIASGIFFDFCIMLFNVYLQGSVRGDLLGRSASSLYTFRGISISVGILVIPILILHLGLFTTSLIPVLFVVPVTIGIIVFGKSMTGASF
ncbi:MAG: MFS transporter [Thermoplasmataceae archaeon]